MPESDSSTPPPDGTIIIKRVSSQWLYVPIVGTAPLIVSKFSAKAKRQMLDAQQGRKSPKQARDPQAEYEASMYKSKDETGAEIYGFPASGFKGATVSAARFYGKDVKMTELRQFLFVKGRYFEEEKQQFIVIEGEPSMREDTVRLAGAGRPADLRYRAEFVQWRAILPVLYVSSLLSQDSVLSLIDAGGMGVGVGEWRPEHRGEFGTYRIDDGRDLVEGRNAAEQVYGDLGD